METEVLFLPVIYQCVKRNRMNIFMSNSRYLYNFSKLKLCLKNGSKILAKLLLHEFCIFAICIF